MGTGKEIEGLVKMGLIRWIKDRRKVRKFVTRKVDPSTRRPVSLNRKERAEFRRGAMGVLKEGKPTQRKPTIGERLRRRKIQKRALEEVE